MKIDPYFVVRQIAATPAPQTVIWTAMHQDYSEDFVYDEDWPSERRAGDIIVDHLLAGERGHYGPLEHAQIVFNVGYFPHSVMQQARTHRIGVSFDVQSMRYTGDRICKVADGLLSVEKAFYLRPAGWSFRDRQGRNFTYTQERRNEDLRRCQLAAEQYAEAVRNGMPYEQARGLLPFDYRQHFVVSFTLRALMHFLDLRAKLDAQLEIQQLCDLMYPLFAEWAPEIAAWYKTARYGKARLAP
jgi:thymidylate synthase (FAD)